MSKDVYESPLASRYASPYLLRLFSPDTRYQTWRRLWVALARAEHNLGLPVTEEQVAELEAHRDDINFDVAEAREREVRHDVMSHIHVFGTQCPAAMPIIHLGATSCFVTDNTEIIQMRDGLRIILGKLLKVAGILAENAEKYKNMPTLGFTHYQPAQLTTVGKRFALYLQDFTFDIERIEEEIERIPMRGVKGTTGTQASFMELFHGDHEKIRQLDRLVASKMGFEKTVALSGQTYSRKIDYFVLSALSGIAQSAYKFAGDIRLLANLKEIEEPFEKKQVGSSAMAYKRNPMRSERICALSRYLMNMPLNAAQTHAVQWFERTLDDSANRRLSLPEAFLTADIILSLVANVANGMQVWPKVIENHVMAELPFMATENILMAAVSAGGNRQELHEAIRQHSMDAGRRVKAEGAPNDLIERLAADPLFAKVSPKFHEILAPAQFVGRAPQQVDDFIRNVFEPLKQRLAKYENVKMDAINV